MENDGPSAAMSADGNNADAATSARWIVYEKSGRWAVALRRRPEAVGVRLVEVRSLEDTWDSLAGAAESFLVLEMTAANAVRLATAVAELYRRFPRARAAVVADRPLAACEGLVRQAGAVGFCTSTRQLGPIASMAARHLARARPVERSPVQRIWDALPWREN